jgi:hypothetical protein
MNQPIIKANFLQYEVDQGRAEYIIHVKEGDESWVVKARFSELFDVHTNLKHKNN